MLIYLYASCVFVCILSRIFICLLMVVGCGCLQEVQDSNRSLLDVSRSAGLTSAVLGLTTACPGPTADVEELLSHLLQNRVLHT